MSGELLGRRLLRLDAGYCAGAGLLAVALLAPLGRLFEVPLLIPVLAGSATVAWAVVLHRLARRADWRQPVAAVAAANLAAAGGLSALAFVAPSTTARLLVVAVAMEVAAFAAVQVAALRR